MFNLNFSELATFGYWFNMYPGPFEGAIFWIVVSKMLGGFVLGILGKVLGGYAIKDPSYKKLINRFSSLFFTQGILLALTLFFTQTATPFLSSRFWLIIWLVILIIWLMYIVKYWIFVLPKERKDRSDWQQKQKYLVWFMKSLNCELGHKGEELAVLFLQRLGYQIIERNWRAGRLGELDIIALYQNELCLIEVKTRQHTNQGWPEEAVTPTKVKHLIKAFESYISTHPQLPQNWHFEVVALVLSSQGVIEDIKHYQNIQLS